MESLHETPLAESLHIVLAGITNAGKSSLLNNLFQKEVAVVSAVAGTTTDPVTRKMELGKLGPCSITDTAGLDDTGVLARERIAKTKERLESADLVLFVSPGNRQAVSCETELLGWLKDTKIPYIGVLTFASLPLHQSKESFFPAECCVRVDNTAAAADTRDTATNQDTVHRYGAAGSGIDELLAKIEAFSASAIRELTPVEGIVHEGEQVILVTPIDTAAPAGRLILPQVETIRDLLDRNCSALTVKENGLKNLYENLREKPGLIITDSQAFKAVAAAIPYTQPLTSFSILFARKKGDMHYFIKSLAALSSFPAGGKVLVMEACSHHRQDDDIGTVKIPALFRKKVASDAQFFHSRELPEHPEIYDMVIHCAACMITKNAMDAKLSCFKDAGIPVLNYGLFLAWVNGLLPRALEPIPELAEVYRRNRT